jgi:hypothetical protein
MSRRKDFEGAAEDDGFRLGSFSEEASIGTYLACETRPSTLADDDYEGFPNVTTSRTPGLRRKSCVIPCCAFDGKITKIGYSLGNCLGQYKAKHDGKDCGPKQREPGAEPEGNYNPARRDKRQDNGACLVKLKGGKLEICFAGQAKV